MRKAMDNSDSTCTGTGVRTTRADPKRRKPLSSYASFIDNSVSLGIHTAPPGFGFDDFDILI
jgi:hypothetical protein